MSMFAPPPSHKLLELYPFQTAAVDLLRDGLRAGNVRQVLSMPTGSGKTQTAFHLIEEAVSKGSRVGFIVDRVVLVDQTSERMEEYGIEHGIIQAGATRNLSRPVQVCSAQTLEKRGYLDYFDLLIADECHHIRKKIAEFAVNAGIPTVGLTGTPLTEGLSSVYQSVVTGATTQYLLDTPNPQTGKPYLAPLRIFAATEVDMEGAEVQGGEWTSKAVRERGHKIIGNVVSEWADMTMRLFGGPVKTLVFSADTDHGAELCEAFQRAGHDFRQTTFRDTDAQTRELVQGFKRGDYMGLVSVSKLTKGFDDPTVMCGVDVRANRTSLAEVLQKMGRVMRAALCKEFGLWLDHSGNMRGWYDDIQDFWEKGISELPRPKAKGQIRREGRQRADVVCACGFIVPPGASSCPACGRERRRRSMRQAVAGRMEEVTAPGSRQWQENKRWTWRQMCRTAIEMKAGDIESATRLARAQYKQLYDQWPDWAWGFEPCTGEPDRRVERKIRQQLIAYFKGARGRR